MNGWLAGAQRGFRKATLTCALTAMLIGP